MLAMDCIGKDGPAGSAGMHAVFHHQKEQAEIALAFQETLCFQGKGKHAPPEIIAFRQQCFIELKRIKHVHMELDTVQ